GLPVAAGAPGGRADESLRHRPPLLRLLLLRQQVPRLLIGFPLRALVVALALQLGNTHRGIGRLLVRGGLLIGHYCRSSAHQSRRTSASVASGSASATARRARPRNASCCTQAGRSRRWSSSTCPRRFIAT